MKNFKLGSDGERDKITHPSGKLWNGMTMFEARHAIDCFHPASQCAKYAGVVLKSLHTNAHNMRNKY